VAQVTSFRFEILVGEDASTDGTRTVVKDFAQRYPDLIKPRYRERNLGGRANFIDLLGAAQGDLIALLEGDDCWLTNDKLQRQTDLLDAHPDASGCFHNVRLRFDGEAEATLIHQPMVRERVTLVELFSRNPAPTCSVVLRRSCITPLPDWIWNVPFADWPLLVLAADHGDLLYIDEVMGEYRLHAQGVWTRRTLADRALAEIACLRTFDAHFKGRFARVIAEQVARRHLVTAEAALEAGDRVAARQALKGAFDERRGAGLPVFAGAPDLKLTARVLAPRFYAGLRRLRRWGRRKNGSSSTPNHWGPPR
jgi:glycosyltransferase involved in cell wall biosynthesis